MAYFSKTFKRSLFKQLHQNCLFQKLPQARVTWNRFVNNQHRGTVPSVWTSGSVSVGCCTTADRLYTMWILPFSSSICFPLSKGSMKYSSLSVLIIPAWWGRQKARQYVIREPKHLAWRFKNKYQEGRSTKHSAYYCTVRLKLPPGFLCMDFLPEAISLCTLGTFIWLRPLFKGIKRRSCICMRYVTPSKTQLRPKSHRSWPLARYAQLFCNLSTARWAPCTAMFC